MNTDKCNCPFFKLMLFLVSVVLALAVWYFYGDTNSFKLLFTKNEFFNFLGTVFFIAILPFGIFYLATEKEKHRQKARQLSVLGFIPAILLLLYLLVVK